MKDSTTGEISNLFQELIVSKIKDEIDVLKGEIDEIKEFVRKKLKNYQNQVLLDKLLKENKQRY